MIPTHHISLYVRDTHHSSDPSCAVDTLSSAAVDFEHDLNVRSGSSGTDPGFPVGRPEEERHAGPHFQLEIPRQSRNIGHTATSMDPEPDSFHAVPDPEALVVEREPGAWAVIDEPCASRYRVYLAGRKASHREPRKRPTSPTAREAAHTSFDFEPPREREEGSFRREILILHFGNVILTLRPRKPKCLKVKFG